MLHQIYAMLVKDLKLLATDRGAIVVLFILPIVFIFVMTSAGIGGSVDSDEPAEILIVAEDKGELAGQIVAELAALEGFRPVTDVSGHALTLADAERLIIDQQYNLAVYFPADFSERMLVAPAGGGDGTAAVTFIVDPAVDSRFIAPLQGTVVGFVERVTAYAQAPRQIEAAFATMASTAPPAQAPLVTQVGDAFVEQLQEADGLPAAPRVSFEQVAPQDYVQTFPTAEQQNVPAYAIFGVFFIMQVVATGLLGEKEDGTFRRLLAAPMPRVILLLGKLLPYFLINLVQVVLMFGVGVLVFDMDLGNSALGLVLVTVAAAAAATGLGLMLAAVGRTRQRVDGLAVLLSIVLAALGGVFIPTFAMSEWMQQLGRFTPHSWALAGYQDLMVRGLGAAAVLDEVAALATFAALFFAVALWRFRFDDVV